MSSRSGTASAQSIRMQRGLLHSGTSGRWQQHRACIRTGCGSRRHTHRAKLGGRSQFWSKSSDCGRNERKFWSRPFVAPAAPRKEGVQFRWERGPSSGGTLPMGNVQSRAWGGTLADRQSSATCVPPSPQKTSDAAYFRLLAHQPHDCTRPGGGDRRHAASPTSRSPRIDRTRPNRLKSTDIGQSWSSLGKCRANPGVEVGQHSPDIERNMAARVPSSVEFATA